MKCKLPSADVLPCDFYVLKYLKNKGPEIVEPATEKKDKSFTRWSSYSKPEMLLRLSALTESEEQDNSLFQYVTISWLYCKEMWVPYLCTSKITFENSTNNSIDSKTSTFMHVLPSSTSMAECIRLIFFFITRHPMKRQFVKNSLK